MTIQEQLLSSRSCGILLPLSAMKTDTDWGVGDFRALQEWADFLSAQGVKILQILPLQETAPGTTCPYSALSAFATDPIYTDINSVEDIQRSPQAMQFITQTKPQIAVWHQAPKVPFGAVKQAKIHALWLGYQHFLSAEQSVRSARFLAFEAYQNAQAGWLRGYSLFRALKELTKWQTWTTWPNGLRDFETHAINAWEAKYREYIQFFDSPIIVANCCLFMLSPPILRLMIIARTIKSFNCICYVRIPKGSKGPPLASLIALAEQQISHSNDR